MNDLWPGAEVRLRAGARATVVHPGRHARPGMLMAVSSDEDWPGPPQGVLVEFASGERVEVPRDELEVVWPSHPCRAEPDAGHAKWLLDALDDLRTKHDVGAFVPRVHASVACVLHPVLGSRLTSAPGTWPVSVQRESLRWETVASLVGLDTRAALFDAIWESASVDLQNVVYAGDGHLRNPDEGHVEPETMRALVDVLATATTTPADVFFVVWDGWGGAPWERFADAARVPLQWREGSRLLRGPIDGALVPMDPFGFEDTLPALVWWPADRAWVVHSEIDFPLTLVSGTEALVEALCARDDLEVIRTMFDAEPRPTEGRS